MRDRDRITIGLYHFTFEKIAGRKRLHTQRMPAISTDSTGSIDHAVDASIVDVFDTNRTEAIDKETIERAQRRFATLQAVSEAWILGLDPGIQVSLQVWVTQSLLSAQHSSLPDPVR